MIFTPSSPVGQVFTPPGVARLVLRLALDDAPLGDVLDPSCGDGVFFAEALALGIPAHRLKGTEIDPAAAASACRRAPGVSVRVGDFFEGSTPRAAVIVGNPPYVRTERIAPEVRKRISLRWMQEWPGRLVPARCDLAALFLLAAVNALPPGGRLGFVVSEALLHASHGHQLFTLLSERADVLAVLGSPEDRWFADAAVHGVAVILRRRSEGVAPAPFVKVARLRMSPADAAARIARVSDLGRVADVHEAPSDEPRAWAAALRAPDAWWAVRRAAGDALVPLGSVARVVRGVTTGSNAFFYGKRCSEPAWGHAATAPVLRAARGAFVPWLEPQATPWVAFLPTEEPCAQALAYIERHVALSDTPTLRGRKPWWRLPVTRAHVFLSKAYDARFAHPYSPVAIVADQRLYAVLPRDGVRGVAWSAVLNGGVTALAIESLGRASMGEGALELSAEDASALPVLDIGRLSGHELSRLETAFESWARQPAGVVDHERTRNDRQTLERALLEPFGLAAHDGPIWQALIEAVAIRRRRSGSSSERTKRSVATR